MTSRVCGTEELFSINCSHENIASQRWSLVRELRASLSDKGCVFCLLYQAELASRTSTRFTSMALDDTGFRKIISGFHLKLD